MTATLAAAALVKIAVLNLTATNVDATLAETLSEAIAVEVQALGGFQVIGKSDIAAMLGLEAQKQLLSCDADSCAAEIGGALGVDRAVAGTVSKIEDTWVLNLKLIDMTAAKVLARTGVQVDGPAKQLLASIHGEVPILFAKAEGKTPPTAGPTVLPALPAAALAPPPPPGPSPLRPVAWASGALGVVAGVAGAVFSLQRSAAHDRYRLAVADDVIASSRAEAESKADLAVLSFAVAGVAGVAGGAGLLLLP